MVSQRMRMGVAACQCKHPLHYCPPPSATSRDNNRFANPLMHIHFPSVASLLSLSADNNCDSPSTPPGFM
jgi:hypothetical protein